jgi:CheY-like chemotaxis protein
MLKIALLLCGLLAWRIPGMAAETLVIPGTGSCEAILKELAGAFNAAHPGQKVIIPPSVGSQAGLHSLLSAQSVLARIVVPLDKKLDPKFRYRIFARDAVVFAVGTNVKVENLTVAQLVELFSGKTTDWRDLGGREGPVRVIIRDPADSILKTIQFYFKEFQNIRFTPESKIAYQDAEMNHLLKKYHSGYAALEISQRHKGPIHLLLTDVLMPEMSGKELTEHLALQRPETRVLFMSGHTGNAIVHQGVLSPGIAFIQKPFRLETLMRKVREVLDGGLEISRAPEK